MLLANCAIILPDGVREGGAVRVRDGKVVEIFDDAAGLKSDDRIDLDGHFVAAGFVDLHVHGALGRDTMEGTADALRAICDFHASGGTTSLLLATVTAPVADVYAVLQAVREAQPRVAQIAGVHLEGPFISAAKCGAQRAEFIRNPAADVTKELLAFADVLKRVTVAPEIEGAAELIKAMADAGINVSGGHSDAWDEEARVGFANGMRSATHTFNCMSTARRRGTGRVAGLLEFALSEPEMNCELIADGHHVSTTLMRMLYRAKGASGVSLITDGTAGAGLPNGARFSLGGKECVVKDGVCLLADESALAGSAARMIDCVRTMVHEVGAPLHEAIAMATTTPARQIGLTNKGIIAKGADADFVVLSRDLQVVRTIIGGVQVWPAE